MYRAASYCIGKKGRDSDAVVVEEIDLQGPYHHGVDIKCRKLMV